MPQRTWFITGVSSGFGRELAKQLLERGDRVVGTVRDAGKVADLHARHPETFRAEVLDVTDTAAIRQVVERSFAELRRIDVPTRELLTFSMLVALGGCDPQVKGHVAANLKVGNDRARLIDVLTQLLPFIGYPRTLNGLRAIDEVTAS